MRLSSSEAHSKHQNVEVDMRTWFHTYTYLSQIKHRIKRGSVMGNVVFLILRVILALFKL